MRFSIEPAWGEPLAEVRYLNAAGGGRKDVSRLPIHASTLRITGGSIAPELDAIVACSDLQGRVRGPNGLAELLGLAVADTLEELSTAGHLPPLLRCGAILAGDLYTVPDLGKRGGYGDVAPVWEAFVERFAWVAGVAGNHDDVHDVPKLGNRVHLLDGEVAVVDGLRIGGVGGIIGNKRKPGRRDEAAFLAQIDKVVDAEADLVVLHEGPDGEAKQPGNAVIRSALEAGGVGFVVCGHDHWVEPVGAIASGPVLNVDARCVVLRLQR
jgi:Icc-related predicted phosphoesterase